MTNDVARAVERLTEEHTELIDGHAAVSDPLLKVLWEARYPSLGKGSAAGGGDGMLLNTQALTIYENIDGLVRSWLTHYREHSTGDLMPLVKRLYEVLKTEDAGERLEDRERMYGMFQHFVQQIEDNLDPPSEYELTGACTECGQTHAKSNDQPHVKEGEEQYKRAVRVTVRPGHALVAECYSCGKLWAGHDVLVGLAESMGAVIDRVALRELVNSPKANSADPAKIG